MSRYNSLDDVLEWYGSLAFFDCCDLSSVSGLALDGETVLHKAVAQQDSEAVRLLLENGADPNAQGDMGSTPLHDAVALELIEIVRLLMNSGADAYLLNEFEKTPISMAYLKNNSNLVRILGK